jgi:hypothetical protein
VTLRSHSKEESLRGVTPRGHSFCRPSRREERALRPAPRRAWHGCSALPADGRRPPLGAAVITVSGFPDRSKSRFVTHLKRKGPMSRQQLERYLHSHGLCHTCPDCTSSIACTAKWRRECAEQPAASLEFNACSGNAGNGAKGVPSRAWRPAARATRVPDLRGDARARAALVLQGVWGDAQLHQCAYSAYTAYNQIQNCSMQLPLR